MKGLRILVRILKQTGATRILLGFIVLYFLCALIIWLRAPQIKTYGDGLWYCYAVITTIGFGDVIVTSHLSRVVSMILSSYAVLAIAIITGVVVNYYNQIVELKQSETITAVLDRLEHLPEMSKDELEELSRDVRSIRRKGRK